MRSLLQVAVLLALYACECGATKSAPADGGKLDNSVSTTPCPGGLTHCPGHGPKTFEEK